MVDFMDLNTHKVNDLYSYVKLDIHVSVFQNEDNKYVYIPNKNGSKNILFVTLFWENYGAMLEFLHKKSVFCKQKQNF